MLVDDKLAKEKLARICDELARMMELGAGPSDEPGIRLNQAARLIRNTDLTDCQPGIRVDNSVPNEWIAPAPDQGSVRNATVSRESIMRERCALMAEGWDYPLLARDIRALPDQKD